MTLGLIACQLRTIDISWYYQYIQQSTLPCLQVLKEEFSANLESWWKTEKLKRRGLISLPKREVLFVQIQATHFLWPAKRTGGGTAASSERRRVSHTAFTTSCSWAGKVMGREFAQDWAGLQSGNGRLEQQESKWAKGVYYISPPPYISFRSL